MKLTMGTSVTDGNLPRIKLNFVFVKFVSLKSDFNSKLNKMSDTFRKGSNWFSHKVMSILDVKEFMVGIMKSGVNILLVWLF